MNGTIEFEELSYALCDRNFITVDVIEELMRRAGVNGDGKIDLEEFETLLFDALVDKKPQSTVSA